MFSAYMAFSSDQGLITSQQVSALQTNTALHILPDQTQQLQLQQGAAHRCRCTLTCLSMC